MKTIYKLTFLLSLLSLSSKSQLLNENFNSGLPASWTGTPTLNWMSDPSLGTSGSGCVYTQDIGSSSSILASLISPALNVSAVNNLTVSFKMALVGNNFIVPNIALSYNTGSGPQFLARWGSGFSPNTTYTITTSNYDYQPPLDAQNVTLVACTQTVPVITGSLVSFIFDAEIINGGYVVIDDVVISGKNSVTTDIKSNGANESLLAFPNPSSTKKITLEGPIKSFFLRDNIGKNISVNSRMLEKNLEVDLAGLPNGVYYLSLFTEGDRWITKKIVLE